MNQRYRDHGRAGQTLGRHFLDRAGGQRLQDAVLDPPQRIANAAVRVLIARLVQLGAGGHRQRTAIAVGRAVHELLGKFDGVAMRVPVSTGSLSAIGFVSSRETTPEEINSMLEESAKEERWKGILAVTREQIVSTDIIGNPHAAIADLSLTHVTGGDLCAVYSWYDNEMGYTNTLVRHVVKLGQVISNF